MGEQEAGQPQAPEYTGDTLILSGTLHLSYMPGQDVSKSAALLLKETEHYLPSAKRRAKRAPASESKGGKAVTSTSRSGVTLLDLIQSGHLEPGEDILSCSYQGKTETATLTERGTILYRSEEFSSATAFSIYFKRLLNPSKQGDDGWKSVMYNNEEFLSHYRSEYLDGEPGKRRGGGGRQKRNK